VTFGHVKMWTALSSKGATQCKMSSDGISSRLRLSSNSSHHNPRESSPIAVAPVARIGPWRLARSVARTERTRASDQIRTASEGKTAQPEHRLLALPSRVDWHWST
jgi:hypothetical protein